jgi:predicted PhzF superfamily epimerase YddE/YHI9
VDGRPVVSQRFFTAAGELPACGHGTVAALAVLAQRAHAREYEAMLRLAAAPSSVRQPGTATGSRLSSILSPSKIGFGR